MLFQLIHLCNDVTVVILQKFKFMSIAISNVAMKGGRGRSEECLMKYRYNNDRNLRKIIVMLYHFSVVHGTMRPYKEGQIKFIN